MTLRSSSLLYFFLTSSLTNSSSHAAILSIPHCCSLPHLLNNLPFLFATTLCLSPLASFCRASVFDGLWATESRENSFSRSRSSSVSSIDRDTKEAITTLQFGESYGRKGDAVPTPCLWVGTSLGVVLLIPMSIPTDQEERMEEPVTIGPSGRSQKKLSHTYY